MLPPLPLLLAERTGPRARVDVHVRVHGVQWSSAGSRRCYLSIYLSIYVSIYLSAPPRRTRGARGGGPVSEWRAAAAGWQVPAEPTTRLNSQGIYQE